MRPISRLALLLTTGVFLAAADVPPTSDIVARRADVQLTTSDMRDALDKLDPAVRDQVLTNPVTLTEFIKERMMRQILLTEARTAKWDQNTDVIARANDARDTAIVQLWLASHAQPEAAYPSQAELEAAYEANKTRFVVPPQYHLQQIAIIMPPNPSKEGEAEALKKARDARVQVTKPKADFTELAKKLSQDPNSASKGGDLGWVREDQILKPVRDVVNGLKENEISEPVRGSDSYHVVKLLGTKPQSTLPLDQVRANLVAALRQAKGQQMTKAYQETMLQREPVQMNEIGLAAKLAAPK